MTLWNTILLASIVCVVLKTVGYLVPPTWFEGPRPSRVIDLLTVALLAALVVVQTFGAGQAVVLDARVPALIVAAGLLAARAPFLIVVLAAAVAAALLRAVGWAG
ncbi:MULTISPECIES: AzlD domain-containing protein [unclassified Microbacterium]|uniref:AzlD domain-containing protein n=1 Tax=unclassified Microbacterium TaxID=2609290 RepID=UPI00386671A9